MAGSARSDCPYPGLRPFREQEADLFFGREEQVEDMVARLESRSFLAVVGTSGCGKSSLVRAGLIPALREGLLSGAGSHWRTLVMRPGGDPYARLTGALIESVGPVGGADATDAAFLESRIRRGPSGLLDVLAEDRFADDSDCLLLVDQFEEIFRYRKESRQADDADAFVNLLLACAKPSRAAQPRVRKIHVVITMRSDFIGDCAVFSGLPEAINDSQFLTPRLTR